jgi:cytidine deaminase
MSTQNDVLGVYTPFSSLSAIEQQLVKGTWEVAENAYIPLSQFPVGATILATNGKDQKIFRGCNVENRFMPAVICAERNAATTAIAEGYTKFLAVSLVCKHYQGPGASPCGLCRQVLTEFGCDAVVLNMADKNSNVRKFTVADLLPAASGKPVAYKDLPYVEKRLVNRLHRLLQKSYVPYSKKQHAALFRASDESCGPRAYYGGATKLFEGISDDNSSFGASASAECVAMRTARTAGYFKHVMLAVTVDNPNAHNPIDGECLQVLREFGSEAQVLLVGPDKSVVYSSIAELLPDSFCSNALVK